MIARVWHGVVPVEKADRYAQYLSDFGVRDYRAIPGNRGVSVLRRVEGDRVHFLLFSLWESWKSIRAYAGSNPEQAHYYPFDLECLLEPEPYVTHYEVLVTPEAGVAQEASPRLAKGDSNDRENHSRHGGSLCASLKEILL